MLESTHMHASKSILKRHFKQSKVQSGGEFGSKVEQFQEHAGLLFLAKMGLDLSKRPNVARGGLS